MRLNIYKQITEINHKKANATDLNQHNLQYEK